MAARRCARAWGRGRAREVACRTLALFSGLTWRPFWVPNFAVNTLPNFEADSALDQHVKLTVLTDVFNTVGVR